jgi:hypothetical protein
MNEPPLIVRSHRFACHVEHCTTFGGDDLAECLHAALLAANYLFIRHVRLSHAGGTLVVPDPMVLKRLFVGVNLGRRDVFPSRQVYRLAITIDHIAEPQHWLATETCDDGNGTVEDKFVPLDPPIASPRSAEFAQLIADDFFRRYIPRRLLAT